MVHTDNIKHRYIQSTSPFTTTRRQQEEPYIVQELRPIYIQKISVVVFFNSFLNFNKKSKISGVNELTGSTSHTRRENYMSNEFSELGGECTYLISSSHQFEFRIVSVVCCVFCCCWYLMVPILKRVEGSFSPNKQCVFVIYYVKRIYLLNWWVAARRRNKKSQ